MAASSEAAIFLYHNARLGIDIQNDSMGFTKSTLGALPAGSTKAPGQIEYRVRGRILHTTARGPFEQLVAAIPANISELTVRLAKQGKWGQIVTFQHSAQGSPAALEELGAYLKSRYVNPQTNPVTALVLAPDLEGAESMAPKYLKLYQDAGIESRVFVEHAAALDWVESCISQFSVRIEWSNSYKVGDPTIDEQHQELFKRAAYVIAATSPEGQALCAIRLYQYMRVHLSHEEEVMHALQYPDIDTHMRQHQELISMLNEISVNIANENLVKADLEEFMAHWFLTHIATQDVKLGEYIRAH